MVKIPSITWSSSHVARIVRIEPRRPSLPTGDTRFSIAMLGKKAWGSYMRMRMGKRVRMRMRMRMRMRRSMRRRRRRNGRR